MNKSTTEISTTHTVSVEKHELPCGNVVSATTERQRVCIDASQIKIHKPGTSPAHGQAYTNSEAAPVDPATISVPVPEKGGEGGEEGHSSSIPSIVKPSLPPFGRPSGRSPSLEEVARRANDVYTPAPCENPVVQALQQHDLYVRQIMPGHHEIVCPWAHEHEGDVPENAVYCEPDDCCPFGGFRCLQSHGSDLHVHQLLERLDVSPDLARCKARIRLQAGEINRIQRATEVVLALTGQFYQSGGIIVSIHHHDATGDISIEPINEPALTKALSAAADWEKFDGRTKTWVRCDPPVNRVQMFLKGQDYEFLPVLSGLARQPFFRKEDGQLVLTPGYDPVSKVYAAFDPAEFPIGEPTREAALVALAELAELLGEFHFASSMDEAASLSAMLTAAVRPSLPFAPAFNLTASASGSGKSYLASTIIPFSGPGTPYYASYPTTTEEASKAMLSLLMKAPAVIAFDDMQGDWLPFGIMNRALTCEAISERLLGTNKTATVGTATFIIGTGNNIGPVRDMCRRVVTIRLAPRTSSPATLSYAGRPAEAVKKNRARYVTCALTIIRAWQAAGCPRSDVPDIATFGGAWADKCRHPLIWLGKPDPAESLLEQLRTDPDREALSRLMEAWWRKFSGSAVTLRKLVDAAEQNPDGALAEALDDLPVTERGVINRSKLGWYLKRNADRFVDGLQIRKAPLSERTAWAIVPVDDPAQRYG